MPSRGHSCKCAKLRLPRFVETVKLHSQAADMLGPNRGVTEPLPGKPSAIRAPIGLKTALLAHCLDDSHRA